MAAATSGVRRPRPASAMPMPSTINVPAKFAKMIRCVRLAQAESLRESEEIAADQDDIRALPSDICTGPHRDPDRCGGERWRIIDAVADHRDLAFSLQRLDARQFGLGQKTSLEIVDTEIARDLLRRRS